MTTKLMSLGVPLLGIIYFCVSSYSLPIKVCIFVIAVVASVFVPADGDLTLMFFEKYGASADVLRGKVVWITGASTGLGAALAVKLAQHGVKLTLSARSVDKLEDVKKLCIENGAKDDDVLILPLDVLNYDLHKASCDAVVKYFDKIDVLVSNAGRSQRAKWECIETTVDKELFELNVFSLVALARVVTNYFLTVGSGHHVVTSSAVGKFSAPFSASYCASKQALHGFFETLRMERQGDGIEVTMLCPGPFSSNLIDGCFTEKIGKKVTTQRTPEKMMTAERCAELSTVAIANKLSEVWIAEQPIISLYYAMQLCPSIVRRIFAVIGINRIMKLRDGHDKSVKED